MDTGWQQVRPDEAILSEIVNAQHAFWWRTRKGLLLTRDDDDEQGTKVLGVILPACQLQDLPELLLDIRHLASVQRCKDSFWIAPLHDLVFSALENAGFSTDWDHEAFVYEKKHP